MSFTFVTLQWNHLWHLVKLRCHASREESCFCSSHSLLFVITTLVASKCIFQVSDEMKWSNSTMGHFSSWKTGPNNAIITFPSFVQARSEQGSRRLPCERSSEISKNGHKNSLLHPTYSCVEINAVRQIWDTFFQFSYVNLFCSL